MRAPFQPGDVVVCVDTLGPPLEIWEPLLGAHYRISRCGPSAGPVWVGGERFRDDFIVSLVEEPANDDTGWAAKMFRKIDDEVSESFREQMRELGKPKDGPKLNPARHSREAA
jgi:hypothetical protein